MNWEFSEEELADITRIMDNQYQSRGSRPDIISYFDFERRKCVAFHTVPTNGNGANGSSQNSQNNGYSPRALVCFDVEE